MSKRKSLESLPDQSKKQKVYEQVLSIEEFEELKFRCDYLSKMLEELSTKHNDLLESYRVHTLREKDLE